MVRTSCYQFSDLIPAALDIVSEQGFHALTLRPLAERTGMTLSVLTNMVGHKRQLLSDLIDHVRQADAAFRAPFLEHADVLPPLAPSEFAEFCDWFLDSQARNNKPVTLFFCEALLASANDPEIAGDLAPWIGDHLRFWQTLAQKAIHADKALLAEALAGFSIDEAAHAISLNGLAAYARLRRLCLLRLCEGRLTDPRRHCHNGLFPALVEDLDAIDDPIRIDKGDAHIWEDKTFRCAAAAGYLMVHSGVQALTHRAVAETAGVPSSTLAYHFKTREDLIKGAMVFLIHKLLGAARGTPVAVPNLPEADIAYEISRSTFMLAIEAWRNSVFLASAADMRRKRGINLQPRLNSELDVGRSIDGLGAQAVAIVSIGTIILHSPQGLDDGKIASNSLIQRLLAL